MCGLFGAMSHTLTGSEVDDVVDLGLLSSLRGRDSTGIITVSRKNNKKNNIMHYKDVTDSSDLLYRRDSRQMLNSAFIIAGHCRQATIGKINVHNSHPIQEGKILGMHNGTMLTFKPDKDKEDVSSDSREFFKHLNEHGVDSAIEKAGYGAYALVWFDLTARTINFLRNEQRPLYWVRRSGTIYWASERIMLEFMLARSNIKANVTPTIESLPVNTLHTIDLHSPMSTPRIRSVKKKEEPSVPLVGRTGPIGFGRGQSHSNPVGPYEHWRAPEYRQPKTVAEQVADDIIKSLRPAEKTYIGYDNDEWTLQEAEKKLMAGCTNCRMPKEVTDVVYFSSAVDWFCEDCKDLPYVANSIRGLYKGGLKADDEINCG